MKLYRVCTENKNYADILDYLDKHFPDGYTVIHANGAWQGNREKSLVIEIVDDRFDTETYSNETIDKLIFWLKKHNNQQAVMIQIIPVECGLI